jgi:hypothetical protein
MSDASTNRRDGTRRSISTLTPYPTDRLHNQHPPPASRRVFDDGRASGSLPFSRGALCHLLQNRSIPSSPGQVNRHHAGKLANLPLPSQDPERVTQLRLQ